ncbi:sensor domain-containing diguanylate cyclase [Noviherbaspirillum pedocola]|uniref:Diguanylate cyclase n=1 Tax=Noviherbaspirillum pedocola TaxID=2801341 RepID=A0A934SQ46_9BURK|nr:sensor domain-containing diguanylate cyclase [Noviherbaspirillum pedocola]MBK4733445.1 diguanylate cyclase [Noviherbaspirillum pedocola]
MQEIPSRLRRLRRPVRWWTGAMLIGVLAFTAMACWFIFQYQHQQRLLQDRIELSMEIVELSTRLDQLDDLRALYRQRQTAAALAQVIAKADEVAMTARSLRPRFLDDPAGLACIDRLSAQHAAPDFSAPTAGAAARGCVAKLVDPARGAAPGHFDAHAGPWQVYGAMLSMSTGILLLVLFGGNALRTVLRKEQAAVLAQQRYQQLFDDAINGMAIVDADGYVLKVNRSYAQMMGYAEHELEGVEFLSLKHPADRGEACEIIEEVMRKQRSSGSRERRYLHRSGVVVWARSSLTVLAGTSGADCRVLVVAEDITAEKIRDDRLRRSESLVRNASRMAGIGGWALELSPARLELSGSPPACFGLEEGALSIRALGAKFPARARRQLLAALAHCRQSGESFDVELDLHGTGGAIHPVRLLGQAMVDKAGRQRIEGAWHDLTSIRRGEEALRRSEMRFRAIARVSNDAFWEWDAASGELWRSDDDGRMLPAPRIAQVHEALLFDRIHPEERDAVRDSIVSAIAQGAPEWSAQYRYRRADGSYGYLADRATIMRDSDGNLLRMVGGMLDVTDRRRVNQALMQMAASVPSNTPAAFFDLLLRHLVRALDADGGAIAQIREDDAEYAHTIAAVIDDVSLPRMSYRFADTPCLGLLEERECIVPEGLQRLYPSGGRMGNLVAEAYAGAALVNSEGKVLGTIFVLYRRPRAQDELMRPVLRVFAERATAEIERLETLLHLREKAELLNHAQEAITVLDLRLRVCFWNPGAARIYQLSAEQALGIPLHAHYVDADALAAALDCVLKTGEWCGEFRQLRNNGEQFTVEERWSLVRNELGEPYSILRVGNDVTERKRQEEQIRNLAYYDTLTGLPNRRMFLDRLRLAQARAQRLRQHGALLFLDMDNFKGINDTHGHHVGDMFLCSAAQRLAGCVRAADTVARLGGDEFVVLLEDLHANAEAAAAQVETVAQQLVARLGAPMLLGKVHWRSTASIGVATFGPEPVTIEALMQRADRAMYAAKAAGRDTVRFAQSLEKT